MGTKIWFCDEQSRKFPLPLPDPNQWALVENSYEIAMDFRNFRNFNALWTTGVSKQVNNITLHIANRSKLLLGRFKNKKCIDIINIWCVPKLCFVRNNHENFPSLPPDPNPDIIGSWPGILY